VALPERVDLMLATLTDRRFSDPDWVYERKLDGERVVGRYSNGTVQLRSRTDKDLTTTYPEVSGVLGRLKGEGIIDGEVVAFDGDATSFSRLQSRLGLRNPPRELVEAVPVVYCVFDVLFDGGHDVRPMPLWDRKKVLGKLKLHRPPVEEVTYRVGDGIDYYEYACAHGWEGIIAKRRSAPYQAGRSKDWLKFKCVNAQEFVIAGYTEPAGSREYLGALLVGYYEGKDLIYAGKVGTGFNTATLRTLGEMLRRLEQPESPFAPGSVKPVPKGVHWVRPELVAQIGFAEWTRDGRLRQPRYMGLRDDKPPQTVVRERPSA
jgi:bifunctional non-homologous end joining protein LigD